jgi:hypothetical protein
MPVQKTMSSPQKRDHGYGSAGRLCAVLAAGLLGLGCSKIHNLFPSAAAASYPTGTPSLVKKTPTAAGPEGTWQVFYSWGCGSFSETVWILHPDGTFFIPDINRGGTWKAEGSDFTLSFPYSPFVVYTGKIDAAGKTMEGTMAGDDGSRGCWHARKGNPPAGIRDRPGILRRDALPAGFPQTRPRG